MHYLNCKSEMVNYTVTTKKAELSYDVCQSCGSLWLDGGELDKMAFQVAGIIEFCSEEQDKTKRATRKCPRCDDVDLSPVKFLGETDIVLDHCRNCGSFWLDRGQFGSIAEYLRDEATNAPPREITRELGEDLKQVVTGAETESRLAKLGDTAAAIEAWANAVVFEHPTLFDLLTRSAQAGRSIGMD